MEPTLPLRLHEISLVLLFSEAAAKSEFDTLGPPALVKLYAPALLDTTRDTLGLQQYDVRILPMIGWRERGMATRGNQRKSTVDRQQQILASPLSRTTR